MQRIRRTIYRIEDNIVVSPRFTDLLGSLLLTDEYARGVIVLKGSNDYALGQGVDESRHISAGTSPLLLLRLLRPEEGLSLPPDLSSRIPEESDPIDYVRHLPGMLLVQSVMIYASRHQNVLYCSFTNCGSLRELPSLV